MNMTRAVLTVSLLALTAAPAFADPARLQHLFGLFIKNEASMSYLKYCTDMNLNIMENPYFVRNMNSIMAALVKEAMVEKPGMTLEEATKMVMDKQETLADDYAYIFRKKRCKGAEANAAKAHFDFLRQVQPRTVDLLFAPPEGEAVPAPVNPPPAGEAPSQ